MENNNQPEANLWNDFILDWRFTDPKWDLLDEVVLAQMFPFASEDAIKIINRSAIFRKHSPYKVNTEIFRTVSSIYLEDEKNVEIATWFSQLPLVENAKIYCAWCNRHHSALSTKWNILVNYWSSFFYPFDILNVFDETLEWGLVFGPEENVTYVERIS